MSKKKYKFKEPNGSGNFEITIDTGTFPKASWTVTGGSSPFLGELDGGWAEESGGDIALIGTSLQVFFRIKGAKFSDDEGKQYKGVCEFCENSGDEWETPPKGGAVGNIGGCFAKGTLVTMGDGNRRAIEAIRAMDLVLAATTREAGAKPAPVKDVLIEKAPITHMVTFSDGDSMRASPKQRVETEVGLRGVSELRVGDKVRSVFGWISVTKNETVREEIDVYFLVVEGEFIFTGMFPRYTGTLKM